jgi:archaellum component FlaC
MSIVDFDDLNATTMTVIIPLRGKIYIDIVFPLLKITKITLPIQKRMTKKFKIPFCGITGAILSASYMGMTRGIIKTRSKKFFRNSVTIDICTSKKNVNAKLSSNTIQMCGPDSEELAREASIHLIEHLYTIQRELDYMNENLESAKMIVEWIKDHSKGKEYLIDSVSHEIIEMKPGDKINDNGILVDIDGKPYLVTEVLPLPKKVKGVPVDKTILPKMEIRAVKPMIVNEIIIPEEYPDNYPDEIDSEIANFFVKYAPNFAYYDHYCQFMDDILRVEKIIEGPIEIDNILIAMINYSYTLGMNINRIVLAKHIDGINGLKSSFNNTSDCSVKIELPYEPTEAMKKIRKKYKVPKHTFMVYKSGLVTQSAPNKEFARDAYYKFRNAIDSIKQKVAQRGNKPQSQPSKNLASIRVQYAPRVILNVIREEVKGIKDQVEEIKEQVEEIKEHVKGIKEKVSVD